MGSFSSVGLFYAFYHLPTHSKVMGCTLQQLPPPPPWEMRHLHISQGLCQHGGFSDVRAIVASFVSTEYLVGRGCWEYSNSP